MPIETGPLLKLVFGGGLFQTETWACSLHMVGTQDGDFPGGVDLTPLQSVLEEWFLRPTSCIQPGADLRFAKLNQIARGLPGPGLPGGKQDPAKITNEIVFTPLIPASSAGNSLPGQLTSCVTIHTDLSRGRASKGRFYPPTQISLPGFSGFGNDGRMSVSDTKGMADSAQEMLSELNGLFGIAGAFRTGDTPECVVSVWSSAGQVARGVDSVSVGRVVDTQRRRRSSHDEDRQFATAGV